MDNQTDVKGQMLFNIKRKNGIIYLETEWEHTVERNRRSIHTSPLLEFLEKSSECAVIYRFAWRCPQICLFLHINVDVNSMKKKEYRNRIRVILAEKMITNTYLAEQLGVSKMTISRWCTNTTQPSAPQLIEISRILQCDLKDLYEPFE